jgi:predicted RNA-binding Zn-ribbon protein involved in translation (DUF1610 family)
MKEMWTGVYPNKKEYKYEVRFRTDDKAAYKFVEEACRNAIDTNWPDKESDKTEDKQKDDKKFNWFKIDSDLFDISKIRIVEFKCPRCGKEYLFKIDEITWNDCGWFDCVCGYKVKYEKA